MGKSIRDISQKNFILIVGIASFIFLGILVFSRSNITLNSLLSSQSQIPQTKTFQSSNVMKFTIDSPVEYDVVENLGSVTISADTKGKILVGRNGTNFTNLDDYIINSRNNLESRFIQRKYVDINGNEAVSGTIDDEKIYFIYTDHTVYIFSTTDRVLYSDLDQIAQSFRYLGE